MEKTLLADLIRMKSKINPKFEKEGIQRLRSHENNVVLKMKKLLGSKAALKKVKNYEKTFLSL